MLTAFVCTAALGLLVFGLGFAVSLGRGRANRVHGVPDDPADPLHKLIRAHGNTAEYAPMLAVLMVALGSLGPPTWALWCMGLATASRYLIAAGIVLGPTLAEAHPLRFVGALGTYVFGIALCVALALSLTTV